MRCWFHAWWLFLQVLVAGLCGWCLASPALAEVAASPLFAADEPLRLRLEAPFSQLFRGGGEKRDFQSGRVVYTDASGNEVAIDLGVRVRGRSRAANCSFKPLLLNFAADGVDGTLFAGQNKLKLVTHCDPGGVYEQYLWLEYSAYRVLNLLTDNSLRVRVVEATYYDPERKREIATKPGLLIEDEKRFAARQGLEVVPDPRIDRARYDQGALALVEVFEYFIGNTDWSAVAPPVDGDCCHNIVPFARADGKLVPVPYDFDLSGLVNKPEALPAPELPIRKVRQRLYRGPCRDLAELQASFELFQRQRDDITALFRGMSGLDNKQAGSARRYIDDFYSVLADPARVEKAFRSACPKSAQPG